MFDEIFLGLKLWEMAVCAVGVIVGGFLRGFLGFGAALFIVPVLSIILTPVEAIAIFLLIELPNVVYLTPSALREFDSKSISTMILGMFLAVPFGSYTLVSVESSSMRLVVAVIVLLMVGLLASGWKIKGKITWHLMLITGLVGGFVQGVAGSGGPPFITILLSRGDTPQKTRANIVITLNCLSITAAGTLLIYGVFTIPLVITSTVLAPIYILSTVTGSRYFRSSGNEHFKKAALLILAFIAGVLIYSNI